MSTRTRHAIDRAHTSTASTPRTTFGKMWATTTEASLTIAPVLSATRLATCPMIFPFGPVALPFVPLAVVVPRILPVTTWTSLFFPWAHFQDSLPDPFILRSAFTPGPSALVICSFPFLLVPKGIDVNRVGPHLLRLPVTFFMRKCCAVSPRRLHAWSRGSA